ncbi:MAG: type II toxin-antitoxin system RelE/ParE family toxin [Nanoarchaeota archaeon]
MFELRISPKAERQIKKLKKEYQVAIIEMLKEIKEDPLLGKPLTRELNRRFNYKFKAYRVIYKVNLKDNLVDILDANHRGRVYN